MRARRFSSVLIAAAVALGAAAMERAFAQSSSSPRAAPEIKADGKRPARPAKLDRVKRLDQLFEALKHAPNAELAKIIEDRIDSVLLQSGSATANLLIERARTVIEAKDYDLSLTLLDAVIELAPAFTEAYAQRATVHYLKKNLVRSLSDLRVVVAREPRHFGAFAGLGVILQDIGEDKRALEAFRRAVAIHPHLRAIPELMKKLEVKVEGREI
jgi:tetratricopeptide (TPR) repeat protein